MVNVGKYTIYEWYYGFVCFSLVTFPRNLHHVFRGRIWIGVIRWEPLDVHLGSTRAEVMACASGSGGYEGNSS